MKDLSTLQAEKLQAEVDKLRIETRDMKKSFWKKVNWFSPAATLAIAIASTIYLFMNGSFDAKYQTYRKEKATLELEKSGLTLQIRDFKEEKENVVNNIFVLKDSLRIVRDSLESSRGQLYRIYASINELQQLINKLSQDLGSRDKQLATVVAAKQESERILSDSITKQRVFWQRFRDEKNQFLQGELDATTSQLEKWQNLYMEWRSKYLELEKSCNLKN